MSVKLLTEHHLEFQSLNGACTGSSESALVIMPHCWKSHDAAHMFLLTIFDASIEGERAYGIVLWYLFPRQRSHKILIEILCDMGLPCSTFNNS